MIIDAIKKNVDKSSLSSEEASQPMKEIMSGSATPSQMSADRGPQPSHAFRWPSSRLPSQSSSIPSQVPS